MTEVDFDTELNQKKAKKRSYTDKVHQSLVREAKREGWEQIIYRSSNGHRMGWVVADTGKVYTLRLVGELSNTRLPQVERDFVEPLTNWQGDQRAVRKAQDQQRKERDEAALRLQNDAG